PGAASRAATTRSSTVRSSIQARTGRLKARSVRRLFVPTIPARRAVEREIGRRGTKGAEQREGGSELHTTHASLEREWHPYCPSNGSAPLRQISEPFVMFARLWCAPPHAQETEDAGRG